METPKLDPMACNGAPDALSVVKRKTTSGKRISAGMRWKSEVAQAPGIPALSSALKGIQKMPQTPPARAQAKRARLSLPVWLSCIIAPRRSGMAEKSGQRTSKLAVTMGPSKEGLHCK